MSHISQVITEMEKSLETRATKWLRNIRRTPKYKHFCPECKTEWECFGDGLPYETICDECSAYDQQQEDEIEREGLVGRVDG